MLTAHDRIRMIVTKACGDGPVAPDGVNDFCYIALCEMRPEWRGKSLRYELRRGTEWEIADGIYDPAQNLLARQTARSSNENKPLNLDGAGAFELFVVGLSPDRGRTDRLSLDAAARRICFYPRCRHEFVHAAAPWLWQG